MLSAIVLETDGGVSNPSTLPEFVSYKLHCFDGELTSQHR